MAFDWNAKTTWLELFEALLQTPNARDLRGLVLKKSDDDGGENSSEVANAILEAAQTLLESPAIAKLNSLDLHYHFLSDAMQQQFKSLPCEVDVSDAQSGDEWDGEVHRYVAVSE